MRVEITEDRLSDTFPGNETEPERHYLQHAGDVITVPDELGSKWCGLGWARDVDNVVPTGERIVEGATLKPHKATQSVASPEVGNG